MIYDFDQKVDRLNTYCTQWDFAADRFGNDDVLPFSISDMDFKLPDSLVNYLKDSLDVGVYGYTRWRHDDFLDSVLNWYDKRFDTVINKDHIIYSPTVIFSLAEIMRIKTNDLDNVLILNPSYDAFFKVIKDNNRNILSSDLINDDGYYKLDYKDFEDKVSKSKVFILCSPHNPIGRVWTSEELSFMIETCKKYNVFIISDEIHMDITFDNVHYPILKIAEALSYLDSTCIITSATKSFNFPGLLFSYAIIPDDVLYNDFEIALKNKNGLSSCTILGLKATMEVYNNYADYLDQLNDYIYNNYLYVKDYISDNIDNMYVNTQEGTYLLWIDASYYDIDKLVKIMYNETKVGIMNGDIYGCSGYLRINIGCSRFKLEEGMKRLDQSIKLYKEYYEE